MYVFCVYYVNYVFINNQQDIIYRRKVIVINLLTSLHIIFQLFTKPSVRCRRNINNAFYSASRCFKKKLSQVVILILGRLGIVR